MIVRQAARRGLLQISGGYDNLIAYVLFFMLIPLLPIALELLITGDVSESSLAMGVTAFPEAVRL